MTIRHFLRDDDLSASEQRLVLRTACTLARNPQAGFAALEHRCVGLLFEKPSLRTRVSSEAACVHLGAHPLFLLGKDLQISRGESFADTARILAGYIHLLLARVHSHSSLEALSRTQSVPIVNGLSDRFHPLQALADLVTLIQEWGPSLSGRRIVYLGDANNVCRSLCLAGVMAGLEVVVAAPESHQLEMSFLSGIDAMSERMGGTVTLCHDPFEAVCGADAIYTDVWASMGEEGEEADRLALFAPYQLNKALLQRAKANAIVLHCLPAHRGEEITEDVLEGDCSRVIRQAHNRLPATAALFLFLLRRDVCLSVGGAG